MEDTPRHMAHPDTSLMSMITYTRFKHMSTTAIQKLISDRHVVVTGIPGRQHNFDLAGLRTLCSQKKVFHIHGWTDLLVLMKYFTDSYLI